LVAHPGVALTLLSYRVAAELLERAAVPLELGADPRVVRRDQRLHVLDVEALRARRRADQVAEDGGDQLSLFGDGRRSLGDHDRRTTREAELRNGVLLPALGANGHGESVRPSVGWF
jgi:hypothetical protein